MSAEISNAQILEWIHESGVDVEISEEDFGTPLSELGVDSLDFYGILTTIESRTHVAIPDDVAPTLRSVDQLGAFIRAQGATG
jgi:acyl carrier protein